MKWHLTTRSKYDLSINQLCSRLPPARGQNDLAQASPAAFNHPYTDFAEPGGETTLGWLLSGQNAGPKFWLSSGWFQGERGGPRKKRERECVCGFLVLVGSRRLYSGWP